jgi:hypothetical protein
MEKRHGVLAVKAVAKVVLSAVVKMIREKK